MKHAITGSINAGKSYFARELKRRMDYQIIEVDDIRRHILWTSIKEEHIQLRRSLGELFNLPIVTEYSFLNREIFTHQLFSKPENLYNYSLVATPVIKNYIKKIQEKNSFIVWVFILEENYDELCDGKVIDVVSPHQLKDNFLKNRAIIQENSLFKRNRFPDIEYQQGQDVDLFVRKYL